MKLTIKNPLKMIIFVYLIVVTLVIITKPSFLFQKNGELKEWGHKQGQTYLNFPVIIFMIAIIISFTINYLK